MHNKEQKILLVEDEVPVAEIIRDYLQQAGYTVELIHTGAGVVEKVHERTPTLILLDIMLPEVDGVTICKEIRRFSQVPVIMLTAKVDEIDRILGYNLGADDYICKPVNPREILARVKAVLRRYEPLPVNDRKLLVLDESSHSATYLDKRLHLTQTEFMVLKLLYQKEGEIFSRQQIKENIYEDPNQASDRAIDTCIKKLRQKMSSVETGKSAIRSIYGLGYKFERNDFVHQN